MLGRSRLYQRHPTFLLRDRIVANAAWHGQEISLFNIDRAVLELDAQGALYNIKKLVLSIVRVPNEFALQFRYLSSWSLTRPITFGDQWSVTPSNAAATFVEDSILNLQNGDRTVK